MRDYYELAKRAHWAFHGGNPAYQWDNLPDEEKQKWRQAAHEVELAVKEPIREACR